MSLKEDPSQNRNAVRFTNEADLSSLPPRTGFHDPEEDKDDRRKAIEAAIVAGKESDKDKGSWPKAKDVVPDDGWKERENAMEQNESDEQRMNPDMLGGPSEPNPGYEWVPGSAIPTLNGTPSADQYWDICFYRTSRHFTVTGTDNTFASKVSRMIVKNPMKTNEKGKEGWSYAGTDRFGFVAHGPKGKISLRGDCAGHTAPEKVFLKAFLKAHKNESQKEEAFAAMEGRRADEQFTQITGSRTADWCSIVTTDNTFATKIKKAAKGHPENWVCWRFGDTLIAYCPKGCVGFRK